MQHDEQFTVLSPLLSNSTLERSPYGRGHAGQSHLSPTQDIRQLDPQRMLEAPFGLQDDSAQHHKAATMQLPAVLSPRSDYWGSSSAHSGGDGGPPSRPTSRAHARHASSHSLSVDQPSMHRTPSPLQPLSSNGVASVAHAQGGSLPFTPSTAPASSPAVSSPSSQQHVHFQQQQQPSSHSFVLSPSSAAAAAVGSPSSPYVPAPAAPLAGMTQQQLLLYQHQLQIHQQQQAQQQMQMQHLQQQARLIAAAAAASDSAAAVEQSHKRKYSSMSGGDSGVDVPASSSAAAASSPYAPAPDAPAQSRGAQPATKKPRMDFVVTVAPPAAAQQQQSMHTQMHTPSASPTLTAQQIALHAQQQAAYLTPLISALKARSPLPSSPATAAGLASGAGSMLHQFPSSPMGGLPPQALPQHLSQQQQQQQMELDPLHRQLREQMGLATTTTMPQQQHQALNAEQQQQILQLQQQHLREQMAQQHQAMQQMQQQQLHQQQMQQNQLDQHMAMQLQQQHQQMQQHQQIQAALQSPPLQTPQHMSTELSPQPWAISRPSSSALVTHPAGTGAPVVPGHMSSLFDSSPPPAGNLALAGVGSGIPAMGGYTPSPPPPGMQSVNGAGGSGGAGVGNSFLQAPSSSPVVLGSPTRPSIPSLGHIGDLGASLQALSNNGGGAQMVSKLMGGGGGVASLSPQPPVNSPAAGSTPGSGSGTGHGNLNGDVASTSVPQRRRATSNATSKVAKGPSGRHPSRSTGTKQQDSTAKSEDAKANENGGSAIESSNSSSSEDDSRSDDGSDGEQQQSDGGDETDDDDASAVSEQKSRNKKPHSAPAARAGATGARKSAGSAAGSGSGKKSSSSSSKHPVGSHSSPDSSKPKRAKGSSCHQCKTMRHDGLDLHCCGMTHPRRPPVPGARQRKRKSARVCRKKYCERCLDKFYNERPPPKLAPGAEQTWSCPGCRGLCTCAACKRGAGTVHKDLQAEHIAAAMEAHARTFGLAAPGDKAGGSARTANNKASKSSSRASSPAPAAAGKKKPPSTGARASASGKQSDAPVEKKATPARKSFSAAAPAPTLGNGGVMNRRSPRNAHRPLEDEASHQPQTPLMSAHGGRPPLHHSESRSSGMLLSPAFGTRGMDEGPDTFNLAHSMPASPALGYSSALFHSPAASSRTGAGGGGSSGSHSAFGAAGSGSDASTMFSSRTGSPATSYSSLFGSNSHSASGASSARSLTQDGSSDGPVFALGLSPLGGGGEIYRSLDPLPHMSLGAGSRRSSRVTRSPFSSGLLGHRRIPQQQAQGQKGHLGFGDHSAAGSSMAGASASAAGDFGSEGVIYRPELL